MARSARGWMKTPEETRAKPSHSSSRRSSVRSGAALRDLLRMTTVQLPSQAREGAS